MIFLVLPDTNQDDALLKAARNGDKRAISEIYNLYVDAIYQFVRLRIGDRPLAEDITSTVFERMIRGFAQGKGPRHHLRGWLFQVARSVIYDYYGKREPLPLTVIDNWVDDSQQNPERAAVQTSDNERLRAMILQLSPDQQEVLLLRFEHQLSLQETADIMGKNVNTIKTLQYRAVNKLRRLLEREEA